MRCPRDETTLDPVRLKDVVDAEICAACGGVWLTSDELAKLEKAYEERTHRIPPEWDAMTLGLRMAEQKGLPAAHCPVCSTEMVREEYAQASSVLVDVCPHAHGLWLDRGELEAIEEWVALQHAEARTPVVVEFLRSLWRRWD